MLCQNHDISDQMSYPDKTKMKDCFNRTWMPLLTVNVNGGIAPKRKKVVKLDIWPSFYGLWHCLLISINSYNAWNFEMCMWGRGFSGGGACVSYIIWAPLHVASAFSLHWLVDWLINCCLTSDVQYFNHVHSERKFTNNKWITNNNKGWCDYWPKFRWP